MNTKQRIKQLEKQAAENNSACPLKSWRDFIEWCNGNSNFDAVTEARLQKEFGEFMTKAESNGN